LKDRNRDESFSRPRRAAAPPAGSAMAAGTAPGRTPAGRHDCAGPISSRSDERFLLAGMSSLTSRVLAMNRSEEIFPREITVNSHLHSTRRNIRRPEALLLSWGRRYSELGTPHRSIPRRAAARAAPRIARARLRRGSQRGCRDGDWIVLVLQKEN